jgi:NADH:ubiquinone reductase (H+-translocating)
MSDAGAHRVVVVGGGFGGLQAALALRKAPVELTLVDRENFHLFQPLTYQVATGALSPSEIAYPLRAVFKRDRNVRVVLADVTDIDLAAREVHLGSVGGAPVPAALAYDSLIVSGGSQYSYFGHEEWRQYAAEVKSLDSAGVVRSQLLGAFEAAENEADPEQRRQWLTFVIVGGGPTGVEMSGQIGELAHYTLRNDFRVIDPAAARIVLVEAGDRLLASFPKSLSAKAKRALEKLGITPMLSSMVVGVDEQGVVVKLQDGSTERIEAKTVVWAAGVSASGLAGRLGELAGAEVDRAGRLTVESDLTVKGHPEVFAIGDMVRVRDTDGKVVTLPGLAPAAMQEGRYAAKVIRGRLDGKQVRPFRYHDKGNLATIGRGEAVADVKHIHLSGVLAWLTWVFVHLWYLVGFQNRVEVFFQWFVSYISRDRGTRLITDTIEPEPQPGVSKSDPGLP